jgi:23S rRNA pseudouridine2605 synthase
VRARLQKLLAAAGLASRREAERWIQAGRVCVNGVVARLGEAADPDRDEILVDGRPLRAEPLRYWLLHKPRGVLTTTRDPHAAPLGRATVLDLLPQGARGVRLFPVGRLDLDSEGLLLLTNDGQVAQALLHPSRGCERTYRVTVRGLVPADAVARLSRGGLELDDGPMAPWRVQGVRREARRGETRLVLVLQEGRKRQIRRGLAQLGHPVMRLVRTRMGPLALGRLAAGAARPLSAVERRALLAFAAGATRAARATCAGSTRGGSRSGPRAKSRAGRRRV